MKNIIYQKISYYIPAKLVFFIFIRFWSNATTKDEGSTMTPTQMTWDKAIELWERRYKGSTK